MKQERPCTQEERSPPHENDGPSACKTALHLPQLQAHVHLKQHVSRNSCKELSRHEIAEHKCPPADPVEAQRNEESTVGRQYDMLCDDLSGLAEEMICLLTPIRKKVESLESTVSGIESRLSDLEAKTKLTQVDRVSDQGEFIWRVRNIASIMQKQKTRNGGDELELCSPPFYTSRFGYKLCLWLKFNSQDSAERNFISLYFSVMKGEYDNMLSWPFKYTVTLMLLDQDGDDHIDYCLTMDPACPYSWQPTTEKNMYLGVDKFASLSVLDESSPYTNNDVVYFKVSLRKTEVFSP